jgi:hypothetical protein
MTRQGCFNTKFVVKRNTLVIDLGNPQLILSSAPRNGGMVRARYILNHHVPANTGCGSSSGLAKEWGDPSRYLRTGGGKSQNQAPVRGVNDRRFLG